MKKHTALSTQQSIGTLTTDYGPNQLLAARAAQKRRDA